ncbi:E3 ubiquitin-protein ligase ubr1 [Smittium mucronatum]|uniref:E3 ubiquitin-protein ligase n=1 Tax=Smittium mucronatum TaxID=133383 RepID=A0A1R0H768_9FUNG|nr:E3 ubiquitin-protein ligase ubr1 [Smittium mucronatum]
MEEVRNDFSEQYVFDSLSRELKDSPRRYNYTFNKNSRKELINMANWYLLGRDPRLSKLVIIDENTGGAPRDENQEKNVELIEYTEVRRGQLCGHVFRRGEGVYRCKTCAIDDTCVLCTRCFHATNHDGHDTSFSINSGTGGCCDCGDSEAWKLPLNCRYHASLDVLKAAGIEPIIQFSNSVGIPGYESDVVPELLLNSIAGTIRAVLEFMLVTFATSPIPNNSKLDEKQILEDSRKIDLILNEEKAQDLFAIVLWNDETHSFQDVIDVIQDALDCDIKTARNMVKNVDSHGRDVIAISRSIKELLRISGYMRRVSLNVSIRSARDVFREQLAASLLIWIRDLACFKFRALSKVCNSNANICIRKDICKQLSSPWEELSNNYILRNIITSELTRDFDESNNFDKNDNFDECVVDPGMDIDVYSNSIQSTNNRSHESYNSIKNPQSAIQSINSPIPFNLTDNNNRDSFGASLSYQGYPNQIFQSNNAQSNNYGNLPIIQTSGKAATFSNIPQSKISLIGKVINSKCMEKLWDKPERFRLDWFLIVDLQLWKEVRSGLRELYMATMMLSQDFKLLMALSFGRNYPRLTKAFLIEDQGPEHSVLLFSVQLFTVPTLSVALVRDYGFLYTVLRILKKFFIKPTPKYLQNHGIILCNTESFRNRRYFHIFHDMRYLSSALSVPQWIASEKQILNVYLGFISLFQGMSPNKRAINSHVEFEDDTWVHAFNVTLQVAKSCRQFADCYLESPKELFLAIRGTLRKLTRRIDNLSEENTAYILKNSPYSNDSQYRPLEDVEYLPFEIHERSTLWGNSYKVVKYSVSQNPISFHHPLNWFLANLFRHIELLDDSSVQKYEFDNIRDLLFSFDRPELDNGTNLSSYDISLSEIFLLRIVDYSIRVIVLMAQIRARMWVRNGIVVRSQAHHYREISLRENTYDQDIFLIQFFLSIWPDSDHILISIIDRFELFEYFRGQPFLIDGHQENQNPRSVELAEEFLSLLIVLISDRNVASGKGSKDLSRREIVHGCLSLTSYSELTKKIPERLAEHPQFDNFLVELTQYRPPVSINDTGMYELKDEYLEEVDPYFIHFTRNQREEAEEILLSRLKKRSEKSADSEFSKKYKPIIIPKLIPIDSGPFKNLGFVLHTPLACQILFFSLYNSTSADLKLLHSSIIDETLQLIIIALLDGSIGNISSSLRYGFDDCNGLWKHSIEQKYSFTPESSLCLLGLIISIRNRIEARVWFDRLDFIISEFKKGSKLVESWIISYNDTLRSSGKLLSDSEPGKDFQEETRKKEAARARQEKIKADFAIMQNQFMENNKGFDDLSSDEEMYCNSEQDKPDKNIHIEDFDDNMNIDFPRTDNDVFDKGKGESLLINSHGDNTQQNISNSSGCDVRLYHETKNSTKKIYKSELNLPVGVCIVCQDECNHSKPYGVLALMQSTYILRLAPLNSTEHVMEILDQPFSLNNDESLQTINSYIKADISETGPSGQKFEVEKLEEKDFGDFEFKNSNDPTDINDLSFLYKDTSMSMGAYSGLGGFPPHYRDKGSFSSSCGHLMHQKCFEQYCNEIKTKHQRQPTRNHPESLERLEFLCPLCNSLGNFLLPILPEMDFNPTIEEIKQPPSAETFEFIDPDWLNNELGSVFAKLQNYVDPKTHIASQKNSEYDIFSEPSSSKERRNETDNFKDSRPISSRMDSTNFPQSSHELENIGNGAHMFRSGSFVNRNMGFDSYNFDNTQIRTMRIPPIRWPYDIVNRTTHGYTEGWSSIKHLMIGNRGGFGSELDINEWRMIMPIYLYIFSVSPEWRTHVSRIQKILKPLPRNSKKRHLAVDDNYSDSESRNNYHNPILNLSENQPDNLIARNLSLNFPLIGSGLGINSNLSTNNNNLSTNSPALNQINLGFQNQTDNPTNLVQNRNLEGNPENFSWSQLESIGSVVTHATAGSPPWPGHSGVNVQNVFSNAPQSLEVDQIQNDFDTFEETVHRLTGFDLNSHIRNEQFLGQDAILSQLSSYKIIYKQISSVAKIIQGDKKIGLPSSKVFSHIVKAGIEFSSSKSGILTDISDDFNKSNSSSKFQNDGINAINARDSSELSSNPESVDNDHLPFENPANSLSLSEQIRRQSLMQAHISNIPNTPDFSQLPNSSSNNYTNPLLNLGPGTPFPHPTLNPDRGYRGFNSTPLPPVELPAFEEIIIPSDEISFDDRQDSRSLNGNLGQSDLNNRNNQTGPDKKISINTPPNDFESFISRLFAETIMCLEISSRGTFTPVNFDLDDPRRNSPSNTWVDGISSSQLVFVHALSKFAQKQYSLLLTDTTSITEFCSSSEYGNYDQDFISKKNIVVTDVATSIFMSSIKLSVMSSLLKIIEPLRPSVLNFAKFHKLPFPTGLDPNGLPNKPFLMENPFFLLTELTVSIQNPFSIDIWQLVRLLFVVEIVRVCISVGDSVSGNYGGAPIRISSTLCPLAFSSNDKNNIPSDIYSSSFSHPTSNPEKNKWTEDPISHKTPMFSKFDELFNAFKLIDPRIRNSHKDIDDLICRLVAWTRVLLFPNSHENNVELRLNILLQSSPMYSISLLVAHLLMPFLRRASGLLAIVFGIKLPDTSNTINSDKNNSFQEFVDLWNFLRLPSPLKVFSLQFSSAPLVAIIKRWVSQLAEFRSAHTSPVSVGSGYTMAIPVEMPLPFYLTKIPRRFEVLFENSYKAHCMQCNAVPQDPSICLLCGRFVCTQTFCCLVDGVGECNNHLKICGGNTGLFLPVKKCGLLLLNNSIGCFMQAPYLDIHGEADLGLKRGRPLLLNTMRFEDIRRLAVNQKISITVARKIEEIFDIGGWETL